MIRENVDKFGAQTIGIHGQELPAYMDKEESKKYWTFFPRNSCPDVQSQVLLK